MVRLVVGVTLFLVGMALFWPVVASVVVAMSMGVSARRGEKGLTYAAWIGLALSLVWIAAAGYGLMRWT